MNCPKYGWDAADEVQKGTVKSSSVEEIKKWIDQHPNIPKLCDEQVVLFLTSCNNDLLATTNTILAYFKCKHSSPEFFSQRNVDCDTLRVTFDAIESAVMTSRTKDNHAVVVSRLKDTNYWNWNVESSIKYLFMCLDVIIQEKLCKGYIIVFDLKGVGLMHLTRLKIGIIKKFFAYLQEGLPCQLKEIHVLNCNYIFDKLLIIIKPFMKKELFDMLHLHQASYDMNEFFEKHAPEYCMPADYRGSLPPMNVLCKTTIDKFVKLRHFFDEEERQARQFQK